MCLRLQFFSKHIEVLSLILLFNVLMAAYEQRSLVGSKLTTEANDVSRVPFVSLITACSVLELAGFISTSNTTTLTTCVLYIEK
jgi:hypothetical protein